VPADVATVIHCSQKKPWFFCHLRIETQRDIRFVKHGRKIGAATTRDYEAMADALIWLPR
jgi:hypothetical protein